jgi:DNA-binding MarR family transcriptional regulator
MLSIQDFPQCPRFTWITSYIDDIDSLKIKNHLTIIMALLVHDGIDIKQIADMVYLQKSRLQKALPRLKKESLIYY